MMKSMLISIIMGMMKSIITKMIIMSIIRSIMNMIRLRMRGIRSKVMNSKNKIIRNRRMMGISARRMPYHYHLYNHSQPHLIPHYLSPPVGTSSTLLFLPPVLPNISMTTSRLTLPSCNRYCTLLARLSVPQSAIKLPSISKI